MRVVRLIRTALLLCRTGGTWADGEEWTPEDAARLAMFLRGETGAKLARRLRNAALALNAGAVQRAEPWRNGQAAGYMLAASDLQVLAEEGPRAGGLGPSGGSGAELDADGGRFAVE